MNRVVLVTVVALLVVSCRPAVQQRPSTPSSVFPTSVAGPATTAPQLQEHAARTAEILGDGVVTTAEMGAAYSLYIGCMEEGGAHGSYAFDLSVGPGMRINYWVPGDDQEGTRSEALDQKCQGLLADVETVYFEQHPQTEGQRALEADRLASCLLAALPEGRTIQLGNDPDRAAIEALIADIESDPSADPAEYEAISDCEVFSGFGPWRSF